MNFKQGHSFASPILIFSVLFSLFGAGLCFTEPIAGIPILIISVFLWSSSYGMEINESKNEFREYSSAYGLKKGEWKSLEKLPFITTLAVREGMSIHSRSNRTTSLINDHFGVYLLTDSHRTKVLIQKFDTEEEAEVLLKTMSKKLGKEMVQYNPVVSERTRMRRENR